MTGNNKGYLGDGVYAEFDGYHVVLTAENNERSNTIYLEPEVISALNLYVESLQSPLQDEATGDTDVDRER